MPRSCGRSSSKGRRKPTVSAISDRLRHHSAKGEPHDSGRRRHRNPVTGERLVFRKTSRETNGELVALETFVKPNGFVAAAHVHPHQEEQFEILRGTVGFRLGRNARAGVDSAQPVADSAG